METIGPMNRSAGAYQPPVPLNDRSEGAKQSTSYARLQYQSETIELSSQGRAQSQRSVSVELTTSTASFARVAPANNLTQPPEASANTIVNFIEQKLKQVAKEGGDKDALEGVLSDGLIGYETGRDEAIDILKGYGFLTDDVKAGIDKTTELVKAGLDELKSQYIEGNPPKSESKVLGREALGKEAQGKEVSNNEVESAPLAANEAKNRLDSLADAIKDRKPANVPAFNQQIEQYQQQIASNQSFDFKVQTRDGDLVTLSFSSASQSDESYGYQSATGKDGSQVSAYAANVSFSSSSNYQLSIDGSLDEKELAAIENLLNDVGQLSDDFFEGDMQAAFEQAMNIGFDTSEIAAFTLNLSQAESVKVSSYQESSGDKAANPFVARLAPIGERMSDLAQSAIENNQGLNYLELLEPVLAIALAFKAEDKQGDDSGSPQLAQASSEEVQEKPKLGISPQSDYLFELLSVATLRQQMVLESGRNE